MAIVIGVRVEDLERHWESNNWRDTILTLKPNLSRDIYIVGNILGLIVGFPPTASIYEFDRREFNQFFDRADSVLQQLRYSGDAHVFNISDDQLLDAKMAINSKPVLGVSSS